MDLLVLDDQFQPTRLLESYDSLVWTERYNSLDDFQLVTGHIDLYLNLLKSGTVVTLAQSTVPMIVDDHKIERPKHQPAKLTITGRSFEKILGDRVAASGFLTANDWEVIAKTPSDVAYYIMHKICVEGHLDPLDIYPPSRVQFPTPDDYLTGTGPNRTFSVQAGTLLTRVLEYIQIEAAEDTTTVPVTPAVTKHGIRAVRPNAEGTAVAIDIYNGVDRSDTVLFDGTRDHLNDGNYYFTEALAAKVAYVKAEGGMFKMVNGASEPSGLDRRVIFVDGSSGTSENSSRDLGMQELSKAVPIAMFDGSINEDLSPYRYGIDYGLGDIVKLVGDYGLEEKARVTEYIRSEDSTGYKAYPTLDTISEFNQETTP